MQQKKVMKLASRGKRFGAGVIDFIPMTILFWLIFGFAIFGIIQEIRASMMYSSGFYSGGYRTMGFGTAVAVVLFIVYLGVQIFFFTRSQTIGKAILGLRVVDNKTGKPIGFGKMLLREVIVKRASSSVIYLGYIWILIDKYNRGWHDKILDTYVIDENATNEWIRYTENGSGPAAPEPDAYSAYESDRNSEMWDQVRENLRTSGEKAGMGTYEPYGQTNETVRTEPFRTEPQQPAYPEEEAPVESPSPAGQPEASSLAPESVEGTQPDFEETPAANVETAAAFAVANEGQPAAPERLAPAVSAEGASGQSAPQGTAEDSTAVPVFPAAPDADAERN